MTCAKLSHILLAYENGDCPAITCSIGLYQNESAVQEAHYLLKGKEQSFFSNNFILLNHKQICFITIYDGCLT